MILSKEVLLAKMEEMRNEPKPDVVTRHMLLDGLLLLYINDADITAAFNLIDKWYE